VGRVILRSPVLSFSLIPKQRGIKGRGYLKILTRYNDNSQPSFAPGKKKTVLTSPPTSLEFVLLRVEGEGCFGPNDIPRANLNVIRPMWIYV
jgi:hypothetical protein